MRRSIFVGDIQGCRAPFEKLLEQLRFDAAADRLFIAGDLVNRGGESLATLRLVHALDAVTTSVLGNHDLHLLAYAHGRRGKRNAEFDAIVSARDGSELLDWLLRRPLFWRDARSRLALVHAAVDPAWSPGEAAALAAELERALVADPNAFFRHMYGDRPDRWSDDLAGFDRLRTLTNIFTRARFMRADGTMDLATKGGPDDAPAGFAPWYQHLHPDWAGWTLVFGHWSQLGLFENERVVCLDTGCVWGGRLSALVVGEGGRSIESVDCAGC